MALISNPIGELLHPITRLEAAVEQDEREGDARHVGRATCPSVDSASRLPTRL